MIKEVIEKNLTQKELDKTLLMKAYGLMATAREMSKTYEDNFKLVSKYVHSIPFSYV